MIEVKCEICSVEMNVRYDNKFGHVTFICPNCSAKKEIEWIKVAKKPRSAYIAATLHVLEYDEDVFISAVGGDRISKMFWCVYAVLVQRIAEISNTTVRQLNGSAIEVGVILHRRKVK
ncbi:hypothetical protein DRN79_04995 [Methanosarcinales archaeon]|nr:MAG: hypothetical protein DRN79_04995 [Methanosarcinales archaeon]